MAVALMELTLFCSKQMLFLKKQQKNRVYYLLRCFGVSFRRDKYPRHFGLYSRCPKIPQQLQKTEAAFRNHTRLGDKLFAFT